MAIQELKNSTGIHVVVFSVYIVVFSVSPPPCPFFSPPSQFSSKISNIHAITLPSEDRCHGNNEFERYSSFYLFITYITISHLLSVFSKIYCKCCNLNGYATRYFSKMENKIWKIKMGNKWSLFP